MFKCKKCDIEFKDGVQCTVCFSRYDFPCAGITETGYRKLGDRKSTWKCSACKGISAQVSPTPVKNIELEGILNELKYVSAQISSLPALAESVKTIKEEISNLKSTFDLSISTLTKKVEQFEEEVRSLKLTKQTISTLEQRVNQLEEKFHDEDQRSRLNNVEIKGVPVTPSENLYTYIFKIGEIINYKIPKEQINYIVRVPTRGENNNKNIIVSLHNRYIKEDFVAAARSSKPFTANNIGLNGDKRIYINDHLTLRNKNLLNKTKTIAKEMGFLFTWVKGCKIFLRKNTTSPVITIKSEFDLKKLSR